MAFRNGGHAPPTAMFAHYETEWEVGSVWGLAGSSPGPGGKGAKKNGDSRPCEGQGGGTGAHRGWPPRNQATRGGRGFDKSGLGKSTGPSSRARRNFSTGPNPAPREGGAGDTDPRGHPRGTSSSRRRRSTWGPPNVPHVGNPPLAAGLGGGPARLGTGAPSWVQNLGRSQGGSPGVAVHPWDVFFSRVFTLTPPRPHVVLRSILGPAGIVPLPPDGQANRVPGPSHPTEGRAPTAFFHDPPGGGRRAVGSQRVPGPGDFTPTQRLVGGELTTLPNLNWITRFPLGQAISGRAPGAG